MSTQFEFAIDASHPSLPGHFPGQPIVPGVLLLDHVLSGIASALGRPVVTLQQVRFAAMLLPAETAQVMFEAGGSTSVKFSVHVLRNSARAMLASGTVLLATEAPATT
jgi:3-hydroxymyristoyl/3-hydroxydecanoyl-(acyl carrier protein) dehydratase